MSADIPYTFDLERLLDPVSAERPSGEPLRYEGTYDRMREARREDDPRMSQGIYQSELKRADWPAVEALGTEALSTRTKDLQLAAWLTEAWTHLYGLAGAREGLRLMAELCARFWETLHPELEAGDCEARVSPVVWVNEKLSLKIKLLAVSAPQAGEVPAYSYADWESAAHLENLSKRDPKALQNAEARGQVTPAKFHTSVMLTERNFYAELYADAASALEACGSLEGVLAELCGPAAAPSLGHFREAVEGVAGSRMTFSPRAPRPTTSSKRARAVRLRRGGGGRARLVFGRADTEPRRGLPAPRGGRRLPPEDRAAQPHALPRQARGRVGLDVPTRSLAAARAQRRRDAGVEPPAASVAGRRRKEVRGVTAAPFNHWQSFPGTTDEQVGNPETPKPPSKGVSDGRKHSA